MEAFEIFTYIIIAFYFTCAKFGNVFRHGSRKLFLCRFENERMGKK